MGNDNPKYKLPEDTREQASPSGTSPIGQDDNQDSQHAQPGASTRQGGTVLSAEELMVELEERCRHVIAGITDIRQKGPVNEDTRHNLNLLLRNAEDELHTYNATMMAMQGEYPSSESDYAKVKQIESVIKKGNHWFGRKQNKKSDGKATEMRLEIECLSNTNERLTTKIDQQTEQFRKLEKEHHDLLIRFSKLAGAQLSDNNPAIADLSDPDRPTKLGEAYKELYDNEWTDAYEQLLEDGRSDQDAIKLLLDTLQNVADFCKKKADLFLEEIDKVIEGVFETKTNYDVVTRGHVTIGVRQGAKVQTDASLQDMRLYSLWENQSGTKTERNTEDIKRKTIRRQSRLQAKMETLRKDVAVFLVPLLQRAYVSPNRWTTDCLSALKPFIKKCVRITWLMVVQRPPMCFLGMDGRPNKGRLSDVYTPYTRKGPVLDYVVWPALLLHEEGDMIAKGTAQFKDE